MGFMGICYFAWQQELIILKYPFLNQQNYTQKSHTKKNIALHFFKETWIVEQSDIIWSSCDAENAYNIIRTLLQELHEERCIKKKINIDGCFTDQSQKDLFVLFDRTPFSKHMSIQQKLYLIESILKTLRVNNINVINKVYFLVNNQCLTDSHLDFSQGWPIKGYLPSHE
jgi:hypothetical protein